MKIIGTMTLAANPTNYFEQTEQVAFHPGHLPPGIDVTADPLLQGRLFSYIDTQISRLGGPNFNQLPVNRPQAPVNDMFRDGMHQVGAHVGVAPYHPNSLDGGNPFPTTEGARIDVPVALPESTITREQSASFDDHFSPARLFYLSLTETEQEHVASAYSFELGKCYEEAIKIRQVCNLAQIDTDLAATVAKNLGLPAPKKAKLADVTPSPVAGRQIGILTTGESAADEVGALATAVDEAGMTPLVVGEHGGDGIDRTYDTARSIEFDAVVVVDVADRPEVAVLLAEAFRHQKAIALREGLDPVHVDTSAPGVVSLSTLGEAVDKLTPLLEQHRVWDR